MADKDTRDDVGLPGEPLADGPRSEGGPASGNLPPEVTAPPSRQAPDSAESAPEPAGVDTSPELLSEPSRPEPEPASEARPDADTWHAAIAEALSTPESDIQTSDIRATMRA